MHLRHPLVVSLAAALALAVVPSQAQEQAPRPGTDRTGAVDGQAAVDAASRVPLDEIRRYVAVYGAVKQAYVEPVEDRDLMQSAIRGLLLDLDPHSAYLEGDAAENFDEQSRGNYDGIGVEIVRQPDGMLRVIAPIDDTPAARAGVMAGDLITGIDGEPLSETNFDSSAPLRGAPGTSVELTIVRDGVAEPLTIEVQRETIRIASVRSRMLEPGFGYVRKIGRAHV